MDSNRDAFLVPTATSARERDTLVAVDSDYSHYYYYLLADSESLTMAYLIYSEIIRIPSRSLALTKVRNEE